MSEKISKIELDLYEESINHIKTMIGDAKKVLILTNHPEKFQEIFSKNESIEIPIFNLTEETINNKFSKLEDQEINSIFKSHDYQIIVLDEILEFLADSSKFLLKIQKFLDSNGMMICNVHNISNVIDRIKFLDGDFNDFSSNKKLNFFSLEIILLLLSYSGFSINKLDRIKNEISLSNQNELKNYVISQELIDSLNNDPESQTFFYVFSAIPNSNIDFQTRTWTSEFSKNLVTEKLNGTFDQMRLDHEKEIFYLKHTNQEKYDKIKHLEQGLLDKDAFAEQINIDKDRHYQEIIHTIIRDKDAYADQISNAKDKHYQKIVHTIIRDKDTYADQISEDKDEIILSLQQSRIFQILRIWDRIRGKSLE